MITINHCAKPPIVTDLCSFAEYCYLTGYSKPNYPVPAIRVFVDIQPDRVILWDWTNNQMIYLGE